VFVTLQSLLQRIDQLQSSRKSLAAVLAATAAEAGGAAAKKKNMASGRVLVSVVCERGRGGAARRGVLHRQASIVICMLGV
jgi:hypothetical protein